MGEHFPLLSQVLAGDPPYVIERERLAAAIDECDRAISERDPASAEMAPLLTLS